MIRRRLVAAAVAGLAAAGLAASAQIPGGGPLPPEKTPLQPATLSDYAKQVHHLQALAAACAEKARACQSPGAIADQKVSLGQGGWFDARYGWFPAVLATAGKAKGKARAAAMHAVEQRLKADLADASAPAAPAAQFATAREHVEAILAQREFASAEQQTMWDKVLGWAGKWVDRALMHLAAFGRRSPWIGAVIEWGLAGLACALLLVWGMRTVRRQRLRLRLEATRQVEVTEERVLNWMREAEEHAARGAFRDAVHCLYWASISTLEGRRLWHPDRARTPREYLRLLDSATEAAKLLRRQTVSFETIWYGLRAAEQTDYEQALTLHRQLRSA